MELRYIIGLAFAVGCTSQNEPEKGPSDIDGANSATSSSEIGETGDTSTDQGESDNSQSGDDASPVLECGEALGVPPDNRIPVEYDAVAGGAVVDWDDDGIDEVVIFDHDGSMLARPQRNGQIVEVAALPESEVVPHVGDFNGDGLPDLTYLESTSDSPLISIGLLENPGHLGPFSTAESAHSLPSRARVCGVGPSVIACSTMSIEESGAVLSPSATPGDVWDSVPVDEGNPYFFGEFFRVEVESSTKRVLAALSNDSNNGEVPHQLAVFDLSEPTSPVVSHTHEIGYDIQDVDMRQTNTPDGVVIAVADGSRTVTIIRNVEADEPVLSRLALDAEGPPFEFDWSSDTTRRVAVGTSGVVFASALDDDSGYECIYSIDRDSVVKTFFERNPLERISSIQTADFDSDGVQEVVVVARSEDGDLSRFVITVYWSSPSE